MLRFFLFGIRFNPFSSSPCLGLYGLRLLPTPLPISTDALRRKRWEGEKERKRGLSSLFAPSLFFAWVLRINGQLTRGGERGEEDISGRRKGRRRARREKSNFMPNEGAGPKKGGGEKEGRSQIFPCGYVLLFCQLENNSLPNSGK